MRGLSAVGRSGAALSRDWVGWRVRLELCRDLLLHIPSTFRCCRAGTERLKAARGHPTLPGEQEQPSFVCCLPTACAQVPITCHSCARAGLRGRGVCRLGTRHKVQVPAEGVLCRVTCGPHAVSPLLAQLTAVLLIAVLLIAVVTWPGCGVSLPYKGLVGWFLFQVVLDTNRTRHSSLEVVWLWLE